MRSKTLTPRQVGKALGVSESTVRRWCDRDVLSSHSTAGGHRRIAVGSVLAFAREQGLVITDHAALGLGTEGGRPADHAELSRRFLAAARAGDSVAAAMVLKERFVAGDEPPALFDHIVAPAMHELGALWERGEIEVYEEHRASNTVFLALAALLTMMPADAVGSPIAIAAALSGDHSLIAPAMAAIVLRWSGYRVVALGADTPADSLARAVADLEPRVLALSVSHVSDDNAVVSQVLRIAEEAAQRDCLVAIGGRGLDASIRRRVEVDFLGDTMAHLHRFAVRAARETGPAEGDR